MPMQLRVVSVEQSIFDGEADFLLCRGGDGELGILPHHAPLLTVLKPGPLKIRTGNDEQELFVGGGFLEVLPERVTVLADVAERIEDIDEQAAEEARRRAEEQAHGEVPQEERQRLERELETAEARLRLARIRRGRG
jgi:F-type H+-transporting ATPase subunit epsilon